MSYVSYSNNRSSALKMLSFGEKIAKIGPVDPEIIIAGEIIIRLYTFGSVRVLSLIHI